MKNRKILALVLLFACCIGSYAQETILTLDKNSGGTRNLVISYDPGKTSRIMGWREFEDVDNDHDLLLMDMALFYQTVYAGPDLGWGIQKQNSYHAISENIKINTNATFYPFIFENTTQVDHIWSLQEEIVHIHDKDEYTANSKDVFYSRELYGGSEYSADVTGEDGGRLEESEYCAINWLDINHSYVGSYNYRSYNYSDAFKYYNNTNAKYFIQRPDYPSLDGSEVDINIRVLDFSWKSNLITSFCAGDAPIDLLAMTNYGTYSDRVSFTGDGVTSNTFDPAAASVGSIIVITASFEFDDVTVERVLNFSVNDAGDFESLPVPDLCSTSDPIDLQQYTLINTTFYGTGINQGTEFDPQGLSTGTYVVTAVPDSDADCGVNSQEISIEVVAGSAPVVVDYVVCADGDPISLPTSNGGYWEGQFGVVANEFDPTIVPPGYDYTITYTENTGVCFASAQSIVTVHVLPDLAFDSTPLLCVDSDALELINFVDQASNVTFSRTSNGVDLPSQVGLAAGVLYPSTLGAGTFEITASYVNGNGCSTSKQHNVIITEIATVAAGDDVIACENEATYVLFDGQQQGSGIWSYNGSEVVDGVLDFNNYPKDTPLELVYSVASGACSGTDVRFINIKSIEEVSFTSPSMDVCAYDGNTIKNDVFLTDLGISAFGGRFEADDSRVNAIINNGNYKLDLRSLDEGTYNTTLTYTISNVNGCSSTGTAQLVIIKEGGDDIIDRSNARCGAGIVQMVVSPPSSQDLENVWFEIEDYDPNVVLAVGSSFTTPNLAVTTSYYVGLRDKNTGCTGSVKEVFAVIVDNATINPGPNNYFCDPVGLFDLSIGVSPYKEGNSTFIDNVNDAILADGKTLDLSLLSPGEHSVVYEFVSDEGCMATAVRTLSIGTYTIAVDAYDEDNYDNYVCLYDAGARQDLYELTALGFSPNFGIFTSDDDKIDVLNGNGRLDFSKLDNQFIREIPLKYTIEYTSVDGSTTCDAFDVTSLTVYDLSPENVVAIDGQRCGQGSVLLVAFDQALVGDSDFEFVWYDDFEGGVIQGIGDVYTTNSLIESTSYYVAIRSTTTFCEGKRVEVRAIIHEEPILNIGGDVVVCGVEDVVSLDEDVNYLGGDWFGEGINEDNDFIAANTGLGAFNLVYNYRNENGCFANDSRNIQVGVFIEMDAGLDRTLCLNNQVGESIQEFDLASLAFTPITGVWESDDADVIIDNTLFKADLSNVSVVLNKDITFTYRVHDVLTGCDDTDEVVLTIYSLDNSDLVTVDAESCGQGELELQAYSSNNSEDEDLEIVWFSTESSVDPIFIGQTYRTSTLISSEDYYVAYRNKITSCVGNRKVVNATIIDFPDINVGSNLVVCNASDPSVDLFVGVSPQGGYFTGVGVMADRRTFDPSLAGDGLHTVNYVFNNGGCEKETSKEISVGNLGQIINAGNDISVCVGNTVVDLEGIPANGVWSSNNNDILTGIDNSNLELNISNISPGVYELTFTAISSTGCELTDNIFVTINDIPSAPIPNHGFACSETAVKLTVSNPFNNVVQWFYNEADEFPFRAGSSEFNTPTLTQTQEYYVNVIDGNGCESEKVIIRANINSPADLDIGPDIELCSDNNLNMNLANDANLTGVTFSGRGVVGDTFRGGLGEGEYVITGSFIDFETGCEAIDTKIITIGVEIEITKDKLSVLVGDPIQFRTNVSNPRSILWRFGDGSSSTDESPFHYYYTPGVYDVSLDIINEDGCEGSTIYENFAIVTGEDLNVITGDIDFTESIDVTIYPNPISSSGIYGIVPSSFGKQVVVELYSMNGAKLYTKVIAVESGKTLLVDQNGVSSLESGKYILRLKTEQGSVVTKSIIKN